MIKPKNIYVDVDDTLIRTYSTKIIPIIATVEKIQELKSNGHKLYCWSSGGAEYAKKITEELGIEQLFSAFLPKPNILIDDQKIKNWNRFYELHPNSINNSDCETIFQQ